MSDFLLFVESGASYDKKKEERNENHVIIDRKSEFINQLKGKTKSELKNEWTNLSTTKVKEPTTIAFDEEELKETNKNRYDEIKCIDNHRVILRGKGGSYIHANIINDMAGNNMFLATQGPTVESAKDMWRMIEQKQADTIIMLCCPIEMAYDKKAKKLVPKEKSVQYWPSKAKEVFDYEDFKVKFISYQEFSYSKKTQKDIVAVTKVEIVDSSSQKILRRVTHVLYKNWPDHSIPETTEAVLDIYNKFVDPSIMSKKAVVVHCSAGIGRTGSFIAAYYAFEMFKKNTLISVENVVRELRKQRGKVVQRALQYLFVYLLLIEMIEKETGEKLNEAKVTFNKFIKVLKLKAKSQD